MNKAATMSLNIFDYSFGLMFNTNYNFWVTDFAKKEFALLYEFPLKRFIFENKQEFALRLEAGDSYVIT